MRTCPRSGSTIEVAAPAVPLPMTIACTSGGIELSIGASTPLVMRGGSAVCVPTGTPHTIAVTQVRVSVT